MNKTYIGTKIVQGWPMNRADYNSYRGWVLPDNENGSDLGYLVEYLDGGKPNDPRHTGYISWSPKEQFDNAYREVSALPFGLALEAMMIGKRVARQGWNGKGMWVCRGEGAKNLTASEFWNEHTRAHAMSQGGCATVQPYLIMKNAAGDIQMGWAPTQSDMFATDWIIVE